MNILQKLDFTNSGELIAWSVNDRAMRVSLQNQLGGVVSEARWAKRMVVKSSF